MLKETFEGSTLGGAGDFFSVGHDVRRIRPLETEKLSDEACANYLFMRKNPKGLHREQWQHASGCRRYFNVERDTATYKISGSYKIDEQPPSGGEA